MQIYQIGGIAYDSNIYLIISEGAVLIDTGTEFNVNRTLKKINEITDKKIEKIILTHRHYDHVGGAFKIKEETKAEIFIHEDDSFPLLTGDNISTGARAFGGELNPLKLSLIKEEVVIGEEKLKVIHCPGHSQGSISLYEEQSKTLFSGDTIFADGGIGRWDLISGNYKKLVNSIKNLARLEVINLYPGHGRFIIGNGKEHLLLSLENIEEYSTYELMSRRK